MKKIDILLKCITLLHREEMLRQAIDEGNDNSNDLVRTVLDTMFGNNKANSYTGGETSLLDDLKHLIKDMLANPNNYDKESLIQSLSVLLKDRDNLIKIISSTIAKDMQVKDIKRTLISLRNTLNNYYKEENIKAVVSKASYQLATGNIGNKTVQEYIAELTANLEAMTITSKTKDPGLVDEQDIGDPESLSNVITKIKDQATDKGKLVTGWKELNTMLQGGFLKGTMCMVEALQHNYKSGFSQTIFCQLAMNNVPVMNDTSKKPLILYISFEDNSDVYISFIYKYLYYNEFKKIPDMTVVTGSDISKYIREKLSKNGYHVKMLRVNPSEWTYKNLFNKILELEANGYELHACIIDYLAKLPTTGCISSGPTGTDLRDLFNRVRNFFSSRDCLVITPQQMSSDAKQLLRNGIRGLDLLKEVANKGYTEGSRQLDQVVDLEIMLAKFKDGKHTYLGFGRGKDRRPGILDDDKMFFKLKFPYHAPIPENIHEDGDSEFDKEKEVNDDIDF